MVAGQHGAEATLLGAGARYTAKFTEAAGLKQGDPVRVNGLSVGRVNAVELAGPAVISTLTTPHPYSQAALAALREKPDPRIAALTTTSFS